MKDLKSDIYILLSMLDEAEVHLHGLNQRIQKIYDKMEEKDEEVQECEHLKLHLAPYGPKREMSYFCDKTSCDYRRLKT